jgi:hypothetical protein
MAKGWSDEKFNGLLDAAKFLKEGGKKARS